MKPGDLVEIIQSKKHFATWTCWEGKIGVIADHFDHPTSTWGVWFTILINGEPKAMRQDYLKVIR